MKTIYRRCASVLMAAGFCWLAEPTARANISVESSSSFGSITIDPSSGTIMLVSPWQSSAFAQAGANAQYSSGSSSTANSSDVPVPGGLATGSGLASVSGGTGSAGADASIPGNTPGFDTSTGRASLNDTFKIVGASAPVTVIFSVVISGQLMLSSDPYGVFGEGENVFSLSVNGSPVLFNDQILSIGPNQSQDESYSNIITMSMTLIPGDVYDLWGEADSEAMVVNSSQAAVPEPASGALWSGCFALAVLLVSLIRQKQIWRGLRKHKLALVGGAVLGAALQTQAMYIGSDPPDVNQTCGLPRTRQQGGMVNTSLTEGNRREDYQVSPIKSASGPTLSLVLTYNSYNADGSKAQLDVGMGFGWSHSYNALLFQQRGQMFRLGADGRVTQYYMNYSGTAGTYASDTGYFETLTQQPDGSFIVTNKYRSWWHFALVPNTPFLVAGPVYRLIQMGDRNENTNTLSYNASGNLASVTDTYGRSIQFTYNAANHLSTATDPLGRVTTFQYDPQGRELTQITDPNSRIITYSYNAEYQMTSKVDRDGRTYYYMYKDLRPFAVADSAGQPWFSLSNALNWAVNQTGLAFSLRRQYTPGSTSLTDGRGNTWTYTYDTNGYITQITAPDGATTSYTYDPATLQEASFTDADGNVTRYQYDAEGNRLSMTDALGEVTTYTYEPVFNQLTSMTDPDDRKTIYQYDSHGNRIFEIDPLNETNSWTYDGNGNVLTFTDKRGYTTQYVYDAYGDCIEMIDPLHYVTTYTYDGVGNRLSTTDPLDRTTRYQYDALDRLIGQTNALNGVTSYTYDPAGRKLSMTDPNTNTTSYQYDLRGRIVQTTDALGGTFQSGYDLDDNRVATTNQLGHTTFYAYDVQNRLIDTTNAVGGITRSTYDPAGNRLSATDPNTNTTRYVYDALNRVIAETNALEGTTQYAYSTIGGPPCCSATPGTSLMTRMEDPDGNVTFYHYDELNRRVQVVRKNSDTNDVINPTDAVTTTAYDPDNNVIAVTDPNANTTVYMYDADDRRVSMVDAAGDTTTTRYDADGNVFAMTAPNDNTTTNSYDALNRVITVYDEIGLVSSNSYDPDGNVLSTMDGLGDTTRYVYDGLNRRTEAIDALGQTAVTAYDPDSNIISVTDRNGQVTRYFYDGLDRRTSMTDALGDTTVTIYDPDSNVIGRTDANGHTTSYSYDGLNRRIAETYPGSPPNTVSNIYDPAGNLIERIDQIGQTTMYSYNDLYFLTSRTYGPSGAIDDFTYDNGGRVLSGTRNGWTDTFAYDGANRLTSADQNGRVFTYTYNIPGRVQTNTQPSGRVLNYTYDARNRLATLQDGALLPPIVEYFYDDADRVLTRSYFNGTTATYTYNSNNWVTSVDHSKGPALIAGFNYAYDHEGNKLYEQKLDNLTDSEAYVYDGIYRLTNYDVGTLAGGVVPVPSIGKQWTLDPVGNWSILTSNGVPDVRTHSPANELLTDNGSNYLYDADGNLMQDNSYNYSYDEERRLTQIQRRSDSAVVGLYSYDAFGRRVIAIADPAGSPTTNDFYYDRVQLVEDRDGAGTLQASYVYGNYVDETLTMNRAGQTYYYHQNALWSAFALSDSAGSVVERYAYDAYGYPTVLSPGYAPFVLNPWGTPHSGVGNPWLFTGRQMDEEAGLYFYRARYYDAGKGRFLVRDALEYRKNMDLYEYTSDNPVNFVDPSGFVEMWAVPVEKTSYWRLCPGTDGNDWTPLDTNPNKWKSTDETTFKYNEKTWTVGWGGYEPIYVSGDLKTTYYWKIIFGPHDWGCGSPANMANQNVTRVKVEAGVKLGLKLPVKAAEISAEIEGKISVETESSFSSSASQPAEKCKDWRYIVYQEMAWIHGTVQNTQLNYVWGEGEGSVVKSWQSYISEALPTKRTTGGWCWLKCGNCGN